MRFLHSSADRLDAVFQMTSMVDVVFILLSFFVLGMRFRLNERDLTMAHAPAAGAAVLAAEDLPEEVPVQLTRSAGGVGICVGYARLNENDWPALRDKLTEINLPDIPVRIAYDGDLTVQQLALALDAMLASPMHRLTLAPMTNSPLTRPGGP